MDEEGDGEGEGEGEVGGYIRRLRSFCIEMKSAVRIKVSATTKARPISSDYNTQLTHPSSIQESPTPYQSPNNNISNIPSIEINTSTNNHYSMSGTSFIYIYIIPKPRNISHP